MGSSSAVNGMAWHGMVWCGVVGHGVVSFSALAIGAGSSYSRCKIHLSSEGDSQDCEETSQAR
ncbi:hypothetical protein Mapa_016871 [Marchantia paleacea]|nr:hypothetical protein Mapa_016871 [Marchantia paleacea]